MKKIMLFLLCLLLPACTSAPAPQSQQSQQNSGSITKDDAYYQKLLNEFTYFTEYSLDDRMSIFTETLELSMPLDSNQETLDLTFKTPEESSDYQLFYFARTLLTLEESNALKRQLEINGEHGSWTLYNEKLIEKYIYGFFNIKFDCSVLPGYSAGDGGVWYNEEGFGGGCDKLVDEFSNDGKGKYTLVVRYGTRGESDEDLKPPYTVKKYTFRVEGQRFIILSVESVSKTN